MLRVQLLTEYFLETSSGRSKALIFIASLALKLRKFQFQFSNENILSLRRNIKHTTLHNLFLNKSKSYLKSFKNF